MSDDVITLDVPFDSEQTPRRKPGSCWKCQMVEALVIVSPPPGSHHEALRLSTCVSSKGGGWGYCAVGMFLRLGTWLLYVGPDNRKVNRHVERDQRREAPKGTP